MLMLLWCSAEGKRFKVMSTAPQRLDFDKTVEYLEIAVWGYMAAAVVDTAGVMTISYDPVA